ncbi:hypothetical protein CY35_18G054900 [Sphagnum magellanicum]|nr:hypothetical protein CY35_18G054900 [Sphagnum magellanicum]
MGGRSALLNNTLQRKNTHHRLRKHRAGVDNDGDVIPPQARRRRLEISSAAMNASSTSVVLWDLLPQELEDKVLANLSLQELFKVRSVCKSFNQAIHRETFRHARRDAFKAASSSSSATHQSRTTPIHVSEGSFGPLVFFANAALGKWEWSGYDLELQQWRKLPTLSNSCLHLPPPDRRSLKNFFIAGGDGLLCMNVANPLDSPNFEKLIVCNPLTQSTLELPPLHFRRHPVLIHMMVNHATNSFMILVAGSSSIGSQHLCRKTEVYDSLTSSWEVVSDLPGPDFGLNEYQVGVNANGIIYCVALVSDEAAVTVPADNHAATSHDTSTSNITTAAHCCKGLLAYNVKEKSWSSNSSWILPRLCPDATFATTQLLECNGSIYVFSEQELSSCKDVHFCIAKLEDGLNWMVVVDEKRNGYSRGLLVYPEYVCLAHDDHKLCVFNAVEHSVVVYDIHANTRLSLPSPSFSHKGAGFSKFHTLNPLGFVFRPSFHTAI